MNLSSRFPFTIITGRTIYRLIYDDLSGCADVVRDAYLAHAQGQSLNPPSVFLRFPERPNARIIGLPSHLSAPWEVSGIKWIASYPDNIREGLPRASAVLIINSHEHGYPLACLEASIISAARTAAGEEVKKCEDQGIVTYIPKPHVSPKLKKELFTKDDFRYDAATDTYTCPEGARLTHRFTTGERKGTLQRYYRTTACKSCAARSRCTENKHGRTIKRLIDEAVLERMAVRLRGSPEKMRLRSSLVEHPFGTMKRGMNQGYFLMKGLTKVGTEISLTLLAYNIRRVLNTLGVGHLIEAVT